MMRSLASCSLPLERASLPIKRRIDRYAIAVGEPIGFVSHADDSHELAEHLLRHAGFSRRCGVAGDAISAAIGHAHCHVDHLFDERAQRAIRHHLLHTVPGSLEQRGVARKIFPEVIDVIDLADLLDVVEDGTHRGRRLGIVNWLALAHRWSSMRLLPGWFGNTATRRGGNACRLDGVEM